MRDIFFIHGALGDASQVEDFASLFKQHHRIHIINLPCHGKDSDNPASFKMQAMVDAVIAEAHKKSLKAITVFGYSMGGFIGMCIARQNPTLIESVITIGTKYAWDPAIASAQLGFFDTDKLEAKQPTFVRHLANVHGNYWKQVVYKTGQMIRDLGANPILQADDYAEISCPCLLMVGDRDRMVSLDETIQVFKLIPKGSLGILPDTPHPFEQVNKPVLHTIVNQFLESCE